LLESLNSPEKKIITLEDPIEYRIPGLQQSQVEIDKGFTFAEGLRGALRQDPDVVMGRDS
jgi:type II secretory ATPase GspE/PulE/Tfp pilus assembly ATPase PilB-like protein